MEVRISKYHSQHIRWVEPLGRSEVSEEAKRQNDILKKLLSFSERLFDRNGYDTPYSVRLTNINRFHNR